MTANLKTTALRIERRGAYVTFKGNKPINAKNTTKNAPNNNINTAQPAPSSRGDNEGLHKISSLLDIKDDKIIFHRRRRGSKEEQEQQNAQSRRRSSNVTGFLPINANPGCLNHAFYQHLHGDAHQEGWSCDSSRIPSPCCGNSSSDEDYEDLHDENNDAGISMPSCDSYRQAVSFYTTYYTHPNSVILHSFQKRNEFDKHLEKKMENLKEDKQQEQQELQEMNSEVRYENQPQEIPQRLPKQQVPQSSFSQPPSQSHVVVVKPSSHHHRHLSTHGFFSHSHKHPLALFNGSHNKFVRRHGSSRHSRRSSLQAENDIIHSVMPEEEKKRTGESGFFMMEGDEETSSNNNSNDNGDAQATNQQSHNSTGYNSYASSASNSRRPSRRSSVFDTIIDMETSLKCVEKEGSTTKVPVVSNASSSVDKNANNNHVHIVVMPQKHTSPQSTRGRQSYHSKRHGHSSHRHSVHHSSHYGHSSKHAVARSPSSHRSHLSPTPGHGRNRGPSPSSSSSKMVFPLKRTAVVMPSMQQATTISLHNKFSKDDLDESYPKLKNAILEQTRKAAVSAPTSPKEVRRRKRSDSAYVGDLALIHQHIKSKFT